MSASIIGAGVFVPRRVGMRQDAFATVIDDGGGGIPYAIDFCGKLLHAEQARTAAIVASSFVSPLLDRETFFAGVGANVHFGGQVVQR